MITCLEIKTRAIGNALFEYATLFGIGKKLNLDIRLPSGQNHTHQPTGQKIWQLKEIFDIKTPYISEEEIKNIQNQYVEKRKEFNPEVFEEVKDNTNLIGFFQDEQYFEDAEFELRKELIFRKVWFAEAYDKFSELGINPKNCVAIHVRRNDYIKLPDFHPVLGNDYYAKSLEYLKGHLIKNNLPIPEKLLVFSDDVKFCKENFDSENAIIVDNDGEHANIIDLVMYSMCAHYVIANSSYSWWGAWLGNRNWDKVVIAPELWFGPGYQLGGKNIPSKKFIIV